MQVTHQCENPYKVNIVGRPDDNLVGYYNIYNIKIKWQIKVYFQDLKRLFSTDVIIRNDGGNQLKVFDVNKANKLVIRTNSLVDRFNRIYTNSGTSIYGQQSFNISYASFIYSEYDAMDQDAIIASALDIVADESTLKNDMGEVLSIQVIR